MKKITHYFILLAVSLGIVSCGTKFLDVDYYTIVNPEGVYEDSSNVFLGLVGVYHALYASGEYLVPHPAVFNLPTLDMQADGWDAEMINHSWTNEARSGFFRTQWERGYVQVNRANLFLRDLENVSDDVVPEAQRRIYEAEARALRAEAYYYLTINYSRVPMLMTGETYETSPEKARPESDEDAWSLIEEDFAFAASVLDWKPAENMSGRFTKAAALAYQGKANMYMGNFDKAKGLYKQIIDGSGKKLNPVHGMLHWQSNPDSEETIWEVSYPEYPNMSWGIWRYALNGDNKFFSAQTRPDEYGGWGDASVSFEHVRSYEPGDKRLLYNIVGWHEKYEEATGKMVGWGDKNPYMSSRNQIGATAKYQKFFQEREGMPNNHSIKWWKDNNEFSSFSVQLYRYTAVLLDYAECCFRTGDAATGWEMIKQVRNRAWGNLEVNYDPNVTNKASDHYVFPTELLNEDVVAVPDAQQFYTQYKADKGYTSDLWIVALMQERRKEFLQEFSLWFDLTRMGLVEEWLNCEYPKNGGATFYNTQTKKYYIPSGNDYNEPYTQAPDAEKRYMIPITKRDWDWNPIHSVYPIPQSELTANPLCEQNPGY
ncbi:MAG: RagB/SusD family nutrient uptake outer membrane protein [Bacteroidales bacterium]|jgi:hypothetical protein|nr:RagB/SusD family nutrient uptake outer membrane protein [Bacteroidales bacterium]